MTREDLCLLWSSTQFENMAAAINNEQAQKKPTIYPVAKRPGKKEPGGEGWSTDIMLISGEIERRGYFDPEGSIAGGKFFYYKDSKIEDCATLTSLGEFPTHWYYAESEEIK